MPLWNSARACLFLLLEPKRVQVSGCRVAHMKYHKNANFAPQRTLISFSSLSFFHAQTQKLALNAITLWSCKYKCRLPRTTRVVSVFDGTRRRPLPQQRLHRRGRHAFCLFTWLMSSTLQCRDAEKIECLHFIFALKSSLCFLHARSPQSCCWVTLAPALIYYRSMSNPVIHSDQNVLHIYTHALFFFSFPIWRTYVWLQHPVAARACLLVPPQTLTFSNLLFLHYSKCYQPNLGIVDKSWLWCTVGCSHWKKKKKIHIFQIFPWAHPCMMIRVVR